MFTTYNEAADARDAELARNPLAFSGEILARRWGWAVRIAVQGGLTYSLVAA